MWNIATNGWMWPTSRTIPTELSATATAAPSTSATPRGSDAPSDAPSIVASPANAVASATTFAKAGQARSVTAWMRAIRGGKVKKSSAVSPMEMNSTAPTFP